MEPNLYKANKDYILPLEDAIWQIQAVLGLAQQKSETVEKTISTQTAESINTAISKATVDSSTWTLSNDWSTNTNINETWADNNGMAVDVAKEKATSSAGTLLVTSTTGGNKSTSTTNGTTTLTYDSKNKTEESGANFDVELNAKLSTSTEVSAKAGIKAGVVESEAGVSNTTGFEVGGSIATGNYGKDVENAYKNGLINGKSEKRYAPNDNMTYAEAIKLACTIYQLYYAGSVTVKAKTNGNYTFTNVVKNFNIVAQAGTVTISGNLNVPFGTAVPDVTINKNGSDGAITTYYYTHAACTEGKTTTKPTAAGNYWVQVEMAAGTNFGAAVSNALSFTISRANITPEVTITGWTYKDSASVPSVTGNTGNGSVTYKYKAKTAADSAYSTTVPTNAGEYTVKAEIAQTTNYSAGSATANFTIAPKALDSTMVAATIAPQAYTGGEIKPTPAVTDGTALVNNTDFTYDYDNNTYVGTTAKVTVIGKGNYSGEVDKNFRITAVDQTPAITQAASVTKGGNTVDLKPLVANAKGDVTFTISGEANGCSIDNGVLTSGENSDTVKINVAITAKDVNGDTVNEYNAYSLAHAITVTINDKETQDLSKVD